MSARRHAAYVVAAAAGYAALTIWLTWPLAATIAASLPCTQPVSCRFDTLFSAWAVSWVSHALTSDPLRIASANIYYPAPDALYYGPAALGAVPYALPMFLATGNAAAAINTAFLSSAALTALALHWVVWRWTGSTPAGVVAAWAFLMNRWFLWGFVAVTPHLAAVQYLPLIAFLAARPLATLPQAILLMLLITLQCLTDPVYVAAAVLLPLGLLAASRIARPAWRRSGAWLVAAIAGSLVCLMPVVGGYARVRAAEPGLALRSTWADRADVFSAFGGIPATDLSSLLWRGHTATTMAPAILGLIAAGALIGAVRARRGRGSGLGHAWRHASLWAIAGTWIATSPIATVGNPWQAAWSVRLPQYLLVPLGFYQVVRAFDRLGVVGMVGLCLLAGVAFAETTRALASWPLTRGASRALAVAGAALVAVLTYRIPPGGERPLPSRYPLQAVPATEELVVAALRAGRGPVIELPAIHPKTKRFAPRLHVVGMYRSTLHWRPLLNGYSSYWPAGFPERMRLAELLPAASALRALVCETGVRTIVVDMAATPNRITWRRAVMKPPSGLRLAVATPELLVFEVTMPAPGEPGAPDCTPFATPAAPGEPPRES